MYYLQGFHHFGKTWANEAAMALFRPPTLEDALRVRHRKLRVADYSDSRP
ncbi:MAG: hypothetical protein KME55_37525 [Nostoc indistinguendum CM1-VF10]|jgi:hypothetical protein|nr:hypothetical protein [Nostoc indistinguendum CM1-VF10]